MNLFILGCRRNTRTQWFTRNESKYSRTQLENIQLIMRLIQFREIPDQEEEMAAQEQQPQ